MIDPDDPGTADLFPQPEDYYAACMCFHCVLVRHHMAETPDAIAETLTEAGLD